MLLAFISIFTVAFICNVNTAKTALVVKIADEKGISFSSAWEETTKEDKLCKKIFFFIPSLIALCKK